MRPLALSMEGGCIVCRLAVYVEDRSGRGEDMPALIASGIRRMEGEYSLGNSPVGLRVELTLADTFRLGAVNLRVIDKTPEVRRWYSPGYNVSRAYFGARRIGLLKLWRYIFRRPDVYINLKGRDLAQPAGLEAVRSVVQHEFGHVLGFRDQYRRKSFAKRRADIADDDIMYRTGSGQRFMGYHIARLSKYARRGRLPIGFK